MVDERVFPHVPYLAFAGWLVQVLALPLPVIAVVLFQQDPNWFAALLIAGLGVLVSGMGWYFVARFSGRFHLSAEHIAHHRFGRSKAVRFADVTRIEKRDSPLVPYLRLHTPTRTLDITSQLVGFTELELLLRERAGHVGETLPEEPPLILRVPHRHSLSQLGQWLALATFLSMMMVLATSEDGRDNLAPLLGIVGVLMAFIALIVVVSENAYPYKLTLDDTAVTAHYLHRRRTFTAADLGGATREKRVTSYKGFQRVTYPIIIRPAEGKPITLEEKRIWTLGYTPEQLLQILEVFYEPQAVANRLVTQGNEQHAAGDFSAAIASYREAIALFPAYGSFNLVIGDMLLAMERFREAAQAYRETLAHVPDHEQAWQGLGRAMLAVGQWQQAAEAFDKAITGHPQDDLSLYYGALAYARRRESERAAAYLAQAIQINPTWRQAARQEDALKDLL